MITASAGLALALVLLVLMEGIVLGGKVSPEAAEILSRIWIAGVIPIFVGIALIINGLFVSKKIVEASKRAKHTGAEMLEESPEARSLYPADTNEFRPANLSVTEDTTRHLKHSDRT